LVSQADGDVLFDMVLERDLADNTSPARRRSCSRNLRRFTGQGVPDDPIQWRFMDWLDDGKVKDVDLGSAIAMRWPSGSARTASYELPTGRRRANGGDPGRHPNLQDARRLPGRAAQ